MAAFGPSTRIRLDPAPEPWQYAAVPEAGANGAGGMGRERMDTLIDEIIAQTGLSRSQAEQAARVTITFLQQRMPIQTTSQIDAALSAADIETALEQGRHRLEGTKEP